MTQREKLIELIEETENKYIECIRNSVEPRIDFGEFFADRLLAEGVIVPPCKVGDTVYAVSLNTETNIVSVHRGYIGSFSIRSEGNYLFVCHEGFDDEPYFKNICGKFEDFGKTVFLTREEAEKALAERSGE